MTARDMGNALWGMFMRERGWSWTATYKISDFVANTGYFDSHLYWGEGEDLESMVMQQWGFDYK